MEHLDRYFNSNLCEELSRAKQLSIKEIMVLVTIGIISYFTTYAINTIIAQIFGAQIYGDYSTAISTLTLLSSIILLGADTGLGKFLPGYLSSKNYSAAYGYIKYFFLLGMAISIILFIVWVCSLKFLYYFDNKLFNITNKETYLFIWIIPYLALFLFMTKYIRATGHPNCSSCLTNVSTPILVLLLIGIIVWLLKYPLTLFNAIFIYLSATLLAISIGSLFIYFKTPLKTIIHTKPIYTSKQWIFTNIQLFFFAFAGKYYSTIIIISKLFSQNPNNSGLISAILTICSLIYILQNTLNAYFLPGLSAAMSTKNFKVARTQLIKSMISIFTPSCLITVILMIYGRTILQHFGKDFDQAYWSLVVFLLNCLWFNTLTPLIYLSMYSDQLKQVTYFSTIQFLVFILLCSVNTHFFGLMGTVTGYAFVAITATIYYFLLIQKHFPFIFNKTLLPLVSNQP